MTFLNVMYCSPRQGMATDVLLLSRLLIPLIRPMSKILYSWVKKFTTTINGVLHTTSSPTSATNSTSLNCAAVLPHLHLQCSDEPPQSHCHGRHRASLPVHLLPQHPSHHHRHHHDSWLAWWLMSMIAEAEWGGADKYYGWGWGGDGGHVGWLAWWMMGMKVMIRQWWRWW